MQQITMHLEQNATLYGTAPSTQIGIFARIGSYYPCSEEWLGGRWEQKL
jgi:hypothetical protein